MRFAITVTLHKKCFDMPAEWQFDHYTDAVKDMFSVFKFKYTMVTELTQASNIHYHALVEAPNYCEDVLRKKLNDYTRKNKTIGFICVKQVTDEPGWVDYIVKDLSKTYRLISRDPLIRDDLRVCDDHFLVKD